MKMDGDEFVQTAFDGDVNAVRRYIEEGGDVNYSTAKGWTALNAALQAAVSPDHPADLREWQGYSSMPEPT